jgi:hypothetical protein
MQLKLTPAVLVKGSLELGDPPVSHDDAEASMPRREACVTRAAALPPG